MADLIETLVGLKDGETIIEANRKFTDLMNAIIAVGQKGKISIDLEIRPSRMAMGGVVLEVEIDPSVTTKKPELPFGKSLFFITEDGGLSRQNPAQERMFAAAPQEAKKNG